MPRAALLALALALVSPVATAHAQTWHFSTRSKTWRTLVGSIDTYCRAHRADRACEDRGVLGVNGRSVALERIGPRRFVLPIDCWSWIIELAPPGEPESPPPRSLLGHLRAGWTVSHFEIDVMRCD
ncbi:MAG: hypothetical protein R3B82_16110 [Sandaracinaceae bacterium]